MFWICSHPCVLPPVAVEEILSGSWTVQPAPLPLGDQTLLCCPPASRFRTPSQLARSRQYLNIQVALVSKTKQEWRKRCFSCISCLILWLLFRAKLLERKICSPCFSFLTSGLLASLVLSGFWLSCSGLLVTSLLLNPVDALQPLSYLTSWLHLILLNTSLLETLCWALCFGECTLGAGCLDLSPSSTTYSLWNSKLFYLPEPQFPHLKRGITEVPTSQGCYGNPLSSFQKRTTMRVSGI